MALNERESELYGRLRLTPTVAKCWLNTFLAPSDMPTSASAAATSPAMMNSAAGDLHSRSLTSSPLGSPASPQASPESALAKQTNDGSGLRHSDSFANYDRATRSWRTHQACFLSGLAMFSGTWPRAGMTRNGTAFQRRPLVPTTKGTGLSLWPTPRNSMGDHMICWKRAKSGEHRSNLEDFLAWLWLQEPNEKIRGYDVNPDWTDWYAGFPVRWTDLRELETPCTQQSPSGLEGES